MLRKYTVKSLRVFRLASQLMIITSTIAAGATWRIALYRRRRLFTRLNFDCVTCINVVIHYEMIYMCFEMYLTVKAMCLCVCFIQCV